MGVSVPSPGVWPVAVEGLEAPIVSSLEDLNVPGALGLYPNPAINELNISSFDKIGSISLLSLTGVRIKTASDIGNTEHVLSLEGITPGVYLIEVRTVENRVSFSSFIKQ